MKVWDAVKDIERFLRKGKKKTGEFWIYWGMKKETMKEGNNEELNEFRNKKKIWICFKDKRRRGTLQGRKEGRKEGGLKYKSKMVKVKGNIEKRKKKIEVKD